MLGVCQVACASVRSSSSAASSSPAASLRWSARVVPGSYMRDDGRVEVAKFDWSEDVQVTNSAAGVLLNIN